jgi:hypothetical protein
MSAEGRIIRTSVAASAVMGILLACGSSPHAASRQPTPDVGGAAKQVAQHGCGNHDGGACGSIDDTPPTKGSSAP